MITSLNYLLTSRFTVKYIQATVIIFWLSYKLVHFLTHTHTHIFFLSWIRSTIFLKLTCFFYTEFPLSTYRILSIIPNLKYETALRGRRGIFEHTALCTSHSLHVKSRRSCPNGSSLQTGELVTSAQACSEPARSVLSTATQRTPDLPHSNTQHPTQNTTRLSSLPPPDTH